MVTKQIVFLLALIIVNNALSMDDSGIASLRWWARQRSDDWNTARYIVEWDRSESYWSSRDLSDKEQDATKDSDNHKDDSNITTATESALQSTNGPILNDIVIAKALFGDTHKPTQ